VADDVVVGMIEEQQFGFVAGAGNIMYAPFYTKL
jgi:hypothetical protein